MEICFDPKYAVVLYVRMLGLGCGCVGVDDECFCSAIITLGVVCCAVWKKKVKAL